MKPDIAPLRQTHITGKDVPLCILKKACTGHMYAPPYKKREHLWHHARSQTFIPLFPASAGKDGCVPWLVNELGNLSTHWCTRAELAAVLGSLARIPALSAAMVSPCV